jgi:translation initiation factor 1
VTLARNAPLADDARVGSDDNTRVVYSTETGGKCPVCGWPQRSCQCSSQHRRGHAAVPTRLVAKLRMEKKGRGGKTVTVIYDLPRNDAFLKDLSQKLKRTCGTGGAVVDNSIELQGELRDRVRSFLQQLGFTVKG